MRTWDFLTSPYKIIVRGICVPLIYLIPISIRTVSNLVNRSPSRLRSPCRLSVVRSQLVAVWVVVPCGSWCIEGCHRFGGIYCFHLRRVCTAFVFRECDRGSRPILNLVTHYESIQYHTLFSFTAFFFLPLLC